MGTKGHRFRNTAGDDSNTSQCAGLSTMSSVSYLWQELKPSLTSEKGQECDSATVTWYLFIWNSKWYITNMNYTPLLLYPLVILRSLLNNHTVPPWTNVQLNSDPVCLANINKVCSATLIYSVILYILLNCILCAFHWKMNFLMKFLIFLTLTGTDLSTNLLQWNLHVLVIFKILAVVWGACEGWERTDMIKTKTETQQSWPRFHYSYLDWSSLWPCCDHHRPLAPLVLLLLLHSCREDILLITLKLQHWAPQQQLL